MFWSLRGDNLDTRLTRAFDLTGVSAATLRFRVWHDLEEDYDYCYTLGSADRTSWLPLDGQWTTDRDTAGAALGPGYSGKSGTPPAWLDEQVDLSPYAGGPVFVRFECVTDQGYSGPGFAVDEISIPEIGFYDDASTDTGWLAEGFIRAPNEMSQQASIRIVEQVPAGLFIHDVSLDGEGRGHLIVGGSPSSAQRTVAIVAGLAPVTLEPMTYRLWLSSLRD